MEKSAHAPAPVPALLFLGLAMLGWAAIEMVARFFSQHYTSFQIVWMRYSVHLLFMLIVLGPRYRLRLVRTRKPVQQIVRGMLMMGMHLSFIFAVRTIPVTTTMAAFWIAPLVLLGLSALAGERAGWLPSALTLVGFGCVLVMSRPLAGLTQPGILLAGVMALCFTLYMQMTRGMPGEDILASLFYTAFSVWIVLSFLMPFYWVKPNLHDMLIFAVIGLVGILAIYGFDKAAELAPTWVSAPVGYLQPVLVLLGDWGLRGIFPGRLSLLAAALILLMIAFLFRVLSPRHPTPGFQHA